MPCYHPLKAFGQRGLDGKMKIIFPKGDYDISFAEQNGIEFLELPCNQCIGCRLEYSRQWATRCVLEAKSWSCNYFVTLTYDDEHLPVAPHFKADPDTGEVLEEGYSNPLVPRHLTLFFKRFRKVMKKEHEASGIRYFACGEYGSKSGRPHYHLILFNCPLPDIKFEYASNGFTYYRSPIIERCWQNGMSLVSDFSFDCARYVAKYMLKKHKGADSGYYEQNGIIPEFTRSSRHPGIGRQYFDDHIEDIYLHDSLVVPSGYGKVIRCSPPKYYDRLMNDLCPDVLRPLKERRKESAELAFAKKLESTDLDHDQYLEMCEDNRIFNEARFVRPLET